ncbi:hypothetical protein SAMN04487819_11521 [Actinopolyspora alba]|uniref:Uncharacterized protein n=1 Tax=Actinopolyspora alba TaxID=673379 RepID=A0A1I2B1D8_9ACTN|nr:hypothetical protein [Actinopolyspora alba]SFE50011.1 hypothetical protein SAMN04487819_11521 [Actinopolyspora alba]
MPEIAVPVGLLLALARDAELGRTLRQWQAAAWAAESAESIAAAEDWHRVAAAPTFAELERRRAEPGPLAGLRESPERMRRWAETGHSGEVAA